MATSKKALRRDNSTLNRKVTLRVQALKEVADPRVVETHGGKGVIWSRCYSHLAGGVVFEKDPGKAGYLAQQRPAWSVYQNDCEALLAAGVGFHLDPNFFDLDNYGECWPIVEAIFTGIDDRRVRPERLVLVVNDGLRQNLRIKGGWHCESLEQVVLRHGNDYLYLRYLEICRELVGEKAGRVGYRLVRWGGYYCGHLDGITHFACVLARA